MAPTILNLPLTSGFTKDRTAPPRFIVVHYAATWNAQKTHEVLHQRNLSVHATIERDGRIFRHVADEHRCWHVGNGLFGGSSALNSHSLGFEIANLGWVDGEHDPQTTERVVDPKKHNIIEHVPTSSGKVWYRREVDDKGVARRILTRTDCVKVTDHRQGWDKKLWSAYPSPQIESCFWLTWEWMKKYDILPENVIGHEHSDAGRKTDPGPHYPWRQFEAWLETVKHEKPALFDPKFKEADRIKAVQSHLSRLKYGVGPIDGDFGLKSKAALIKAVAQFGSTYGFSDLTERDSFTRIAACLRRIPGF